MLRCWPEPLCIIFPKAEEAKRSAQEFADSLNELRASMDKMSRTELAAKIADAGDELEVLTDAQRTAEQEVKISKQHTKHILMGYYTLVVPRRTSK